MVADLYCRMLAWLPRLLVFDLYDLVLCMVILLMKGSSEKRFKGNTVESVSVMSMLEECINIFQRGEDIGVGSIVRSL